ncbi:hypothetical protein ACN93G_004606 [Enterobacter ludwigii]
MANESVRLDSGTPGRCSTITGVEASPGSKKMVAHFKTDTGESGTLEVTFDTPHSRTVMARPVGSFYTQSLKNGKWVCTGAYGACY